MLERSSYTTTTRTKTSSSHFPARPLLPPVSGLLHNRLKRPHEEEDEDEEGLEEEEDHELQLQEEEEKPVAAVTPPPSYLTEEPIEYTVRIYTILHTIRK